jgi:hypothetical protein
MKPYILFLLLLTILAYSSCKEKEEEVIINPKEKFIGDWEGELHLTVPELYIDTRGKVIYTIEMDSMDGMMRITKYDDFITNIQVFVTDTGHYYNTFTRFYSPYSDTIILEQIGSGFTEVDPVWGLTIVEWGPAIYIVDGIRYIGTWAQFLVQNPKEK